MKKATTILALGLLALAPQMVEAQVGQGDNASINATATVLAQLTVTGQNDLAFGQVIPGIPSTIAATDVGSAGRFLVSGGGSSTVQLSFDLPGELDGPESATMPITFASDAAGWGETNNSLGGTFSPHTTQQESLVNGDLFVFIGGTVSPANDQAQGEYTGEITLNVAYISN